MSRPRAEAGRVRELLLAAVAFYQRAISPTRPPRCRFVPTCSAYALEAIERHGAARGSWLAARRVARCAPWHPGGVDLVPEPSVGADAAGTDGYGRSSSPTAPVALTPAGGSARPDRPAPPALLGAPEEEPARA